MKIVGFITVPMVNGSESEFGHRGRSTISSSHINFVNPCLWTAISFESTRADWMRS